MDYFRKYLGANELEENDNGLDTIEKLVDRLSTSTLLEDRRDALRAIKSLSKKFRLEVGSQAMYPILSTLESDKDDSESVFYALETLYNIMNEELQKEEIDTNRLVNIPTGLGNQFTEMFINKPAHVELILDFLQDSDFAVRRMTMQLLHVCLVNIQKETQEAILKCPMAISKIVDLLSDPNEVIRNDSLLLLIDLVKSNCNIQKIVVFENAYDRLLTIVSEEGDSDGGVIVEDCLKIILALLENNPQNQTLFKEGGNITRLESFFEFSIDNSDNIHNTGNADNVHSHDYAGDESHEKGWSPQKLANVQLMLQIIRSLVSPHNKHQSTSQAQLSMLQCGLFNRISCLLLCNGSSTSQSIPPQLLADTIQTVAECMRGSTNSQKLFSSLTAASEPPQPAVNVLLLSMVNEKQNFSLRLAALYAVQCFLYKYPEGQDYIVQSLLPKPSSSSQKGPSETYSPGKLLCMGLFSTHPLSIWFASVSLMHSINSNNNLKEELLKVQLASSANSRSPISFLQKCCLLLSDTDIRPQAKVGVLMLLCTWLCHCPKAVAKFLPLSSRHSSRANSRQGSPGNLTDQQKTKPPADKQKPPETDNLLILLSELVGLFDNDENEVIIRGLCALLIGICVRFNPDDSEALDRHEILQIVERRLDKDVLIDHISHLTKTEAYTKTMRNLQPVFNKTSDLLFDYEFTRLFRSIEHEILQSIQNHYENESSNSLNPRNTSLFNHHEKVVVQYKDLIKSQDEELNQLRAELAQSLLDQKKMENTIRQLREELQTTKDQCAILKVKKSGPNGQNDHLNNNCSSISDVPMVDLKVEIEKLKIENERLKSSQTGEPNSQNNELQEALTFLKSANQEIAQLKTEIELFKSEKETEKNKTTKLTEEHDDLKTELEDLLVLLSDQEEKINEYKKKLGIEDSDNEDDTVDIDE